MANTFELIASSTVGSSGAASIDFTSIPSTYTDLCLEFSLRTSAASTFYTTILKLNNSAASFNGILLGGTGSAATTGAITQSVGAVGGGATTASTFTNGSVYFPNYLSSNYKSYSWDTVLENNATAARTYMGAGLWSNTAAINRITLTVDTSDNFAEYSTAYLYGVKNA
jgi:hypothetical protein